jgi:hypothetical protein
MTSVPSSIAIQIIEAALPPTLSKKLRKSKGASTLS